ncbi:MAG: hypothetical protein ABUS54_04540 [Actinomycetota bacterium]
MTALKQATCTCGKPAPVERAIRKGVATTVCARCGMPLPLRLGR